MDETKYVIARFETRRVDKANISALHNTRKNPPADIDKSRSKQNVYFVSEDFQRVSAKRAYRADKQFIREEIARMKGTSWRESRSAITTEIVIAMSPSINEKMAAGEVSKEQLVELFKESYRRIADEIGLKFVSCAIHFDEKTPHAHATFSVFDENKKSMRTKLMKSGALMQDIAGDVFSEIDFRRGVRKSTAEHLKIKEMRALARADVNAARVEKKVVDSWKKRKSKLRGRVESAFNDALKIGNKKKRERALWNIIEKIALMYYKAKVPDIAIEEKGLYIERVAAKAKARERRFDDAVRAEVEAIMLDISTELDELKKENRALRKSLEYTENLVDAMNVEAGSVRELESKIEALAEELNAARVENKALRKENKALSKRRKRGNDLSR